MYCQGDGKVTLTRPILMLANVTSDEHVKVLEMWYIRHKLLYLACGSLSKT